LKTAGTDGDPFSGQVSDHSTAAAAGILQLESVDPGHDLQRRLTDLHRPVVERRSRQAQKSALPAYAELRMAVIDQLSQVTGVRKDEIFLSHSSST
jgi:hypothetical protein